MKRREKEGNAESALASDFLTKRIIHENVCTQRDARESKAEAGSATSGVRTVMQKKKKKKETAVLCLTSVPLRVPSQ